MEQLIKSLMDAGVAKSEVEAKNILNDMPFKKICLAAKMAFATAEAHRKANIAALNRGKLLMDFLHQRSEAQFKVEGKQLTLEDATDLAEVFAQLTGQLSGVRNDRRS